MLDHMHRDSKCETAATSRPYRSALFELRRTLFAVDASKLRESVTSLASVLPLLPIVHETVFGNKRKQPIAK
jgi:hypothetical protein